MLASATFLVTRVLAMGTRLYVSAIIVVLAVQLWRGQEVTPWEKFWLFTGALMLVTGLSGSIFWPTTSFLSSHFGWRGTCLVYAAMLLLVSLPLYAFATPRRTVAKEVGGAAPTKQTNAPSIPRSTFGLVVAAITLNAFVTFGMSAVFIELLRAEGLAPAQAIAFGSMLGVIQVSVRGLDFLGGGRWDGITTGLVAGTALPVAMLPLMLSEGATWAVAVFILLYGAGSGAMAVARATIPLVFYDQAEFAKATSMIAMPLAKSCATILPSVFVSSISVTSTVRAPRTT